MCSVGVWRVSVLSGGEWGVGDDMFWNAGLEQAL